jgi:pectate lyase
VWIDHLDILDGGDGNLDITRGSNYITVSWTKFSYTSASTYHTWSNLIGASDEHTTDRGKLKVTMHHNFWAPGATRRMPNVRFGQVHVVNNYYRSEKNEFCIGANFEADMLIESNVFEWVNDPIRYLSSAKAAEMKNNLFIAVSGKKTGKGKAFTPPYPYTITAVEDVESLVRKNAGPRDLNDLICGGQINLDCHGVYNGAAYLDSCGVCVGGETDRLPCIGTLEAETACGIDGVSLETENAGYSGGGYVNTDNNFGASASWIFNNVDNSTATLAFRYANGGGSARDGDLFINGVKTGTISLAVTGSWTNWELSSIQVPFSLGSNEVKLVATSNDGLANLDWVSYSGNTSGANCITTSNSKKNTIHKQTLSFNPKTSIVHLSTPGEWELYNSSGQTRSSGKGESFSLIEQDKGIYFVFFGGQHYRVINY